MVEEKPKARAVSKTVTGCLRFQVGSGPSAQPCLAADQPQALFSPVEGLVMRLAAEGGRQVSLYAHSSLHEAI